MDKPGPIDPDAVEARLLRRSALVVDGDPDRRSKFALANLAYPPAAMAADLAGAVAELRRLRVQVEPGGPAEHMAELAEARRLLNIYELTTRALALGRIGKAGALDVLLPLKRRGRAR